MVRGSRNPFVRWPGERWLTFIAINKARLPVPEGRRTVVKACKVWEGVSLTVARSKKEASRESSLRSRPILRAQVKCSLRHQDSARRLNKLPKRRGNLLPSDTVYDPLLRHRLIRIHRSHFPTIDAAEFPRETASLRFHQRRTVPLLSIPTEDLCRRYCGNTRYRGYTRGYRWNGRRAPKENDRSETVRSSGSVKVCARRWPHANRGIDPTVERRSDGDSTSRDQDFRSHGLYEHLAIKAFLSRFSRIGKGTGSRGRLPDASIARAR